MQDQGKSGHAGRSYNKHYINITNIKRHKDFGHHANFQGGEKLVDVSLKFSSNSSCCGSTHYSAQARGLLIPFPQSGKCQGPQGVLHTFHSFKNISISSLCHSHSSYYCLSSDLRSQVLIPSLRRQMQADISIFESALPIE